MNLIRLKWLFLLLMTGVSPFGYAQDRPQAKLPLNVISFNIRYNNPADGVNAWPHRKAMAAKVFTDYGVDFGGLQEALTDQIRDLQDQLPAYAWIGVGREDGKEGGEFAPIFYKRDRFELVKQGTFWLSERPDEPGSKSWDAALPRVATYGIFAERKTGKHLFVINTHFDHRGEQARQRSAQLLMTQIKKLSGDLPVILTGDFNSPENAPALKTLTGDDHLKLTNTEKLSEAPHFGGSGTFNDFKAGPATQTIDFVLVGPGLEVKRHDFLTVYDAKRDVLISDHWPVLSRLQLTL